MMYSNFAPRNNSGFVKVHFRQIAFITLTYSCNVIHFTLQISIECHVECVVPLGHFA